MFEFSPPTLNAPEEPADSAFYGEPVLSVNIPAKSLVDGITGRYSAKNGCFVPRSRMAIVNGEVYLDKLAPTKQEKVPDPLQGVTE